MAHLPNLAVLKPGLSRDIKGEHKAVKDYSTRIGQAKGSGVTPTLKHIKSEEVEHGKELHRALEGLKRSK